MKLSANAPGGPVTRFRIFRLVMLVLVVSFGLRCGDAPTQPLTPMSSPAAASTTVTIPIRLQGPWHGTFTFSGCTDQVELTLTQRGNTISGHLSAGCAPGPGGYLSGTFDGNHVTIQLIFEGLRYHLVGTASSFKIDVSYGGNDEAMSLHLVRSFSPRP